MRNLSVVLLALVFSGISKAQPGYSIKFNLKGCHDTCAYLVKYIFDQQYLVDTCKKINNGLITFTGKSTLDKGMYAIAGQGMTKYVDIFVDENSRITLNADITDVSATLKSPDSKENELMFGYARFMNGKEKEYRKAAQEPDGKAKQKVINTEVKVYTDAFMQKNKGSFVCDFLNLRVEKYATSIPKASNGRPDSLYQYYYYKAHYLDGIDFKDDRIARVPFFDERMKKYFSEIVVQHPDTLIRDIDKVMAKCNEDNLIYNQLLGYLMYKYEQNKTMTFDRQGKTITYDKVLVHLAETYVVSGKATKIYDKATVEKLKERVAVMRNLLPETKVPEIFMVDTTYGRRVLKMGFDTAKTSKGLTDLYYKHAQELTPIFKTLYQVNAKYTVLVFWAVDCDHCQKDVPRLQEMLEEFKGRVDVKVFAVQTREDLFEDWRKFIIEKKLDFINVFDPVHLNNTKEKFDVTSTPTMYVLDKDKKIKGKNLAAEQVIEVINNLEAIEHL